MKKFNKLILLALALAVWSLPGFAQNKSNNYYKTNASGWVDEMLSSNGNVYKAKRAFDLYWGEKDLTKKHATKGKGYKPFLRWYEHMKPRVYPTGNLPNPTMAYKEFNKFSSNNSSPKSANWTFMGPTNPTGYVNNGSYQSPGGSGRVNAITFDPNNSDIIWIGTPAGGLWKSINGGASWTIVSDQFDNMGISAIAIDYNNTNIIYIGTGDRDAGDTNSTGIMKSTDGGATWSSTSVTFSKSQGARCTDILMHPTNPNILLASFNGLVYRTTDGFSSKSTALSSVVMDMEFKPGDPNTVYAAGSSFYKSTNGGASFSQVTSGLPTSGVQRMEIAVSADAASKVWILAGSSSDQGMKGIYRSTNSGGSFSTIYSSSSGNLLGWETNPSSNVGDGGQAFYDLSFAVNPSNENEMFVGGVNLYKSSNGGTSWSCSAYWLDGSSYAYAHADYHAIEYLNNSTLFVGNDGGIFKSSNNGSNWSDLSNNLGIAQVARIGLSASSPDIIMTGMQDNGTNKYNSGTWSIVYGGDGCETAVDPTNTSVMYCSYVYGAIKRSTNGGSSWTSIKPSASGGAWITPFVIDPNDNSTLYSGFDHIYKTTDKGSNWSKIGTTPGSGNILQIAVAPSNSNYIYFIKEGYTVGKTTNGGSSWASIGSGLPLSDAAPTYIAVSATDPQTLWVTFSGYESGKKVYKSTNAGSSWTNVSGNLPNLPFNTVVYQNGSDDLVYVGGDQGVYYKDNSMSNWTLYNTNLPNTVIKELEIYYDSSNPANSKLRAATYGRSVWETPLAGGTATCAIPSGLQATDVTSSSAKLTWNSVSEATDYDVRYKDVTLSTWHTYNTTSTYKTITGLSTDDTQYEFQVRTNCSSGTSAYSASSNFGYTPVTYCESSGKTSDEWIERVKINTIDNTSGASSSAYADFTSMSTDLSRGLSETITIYPGWSGTVYDEGYKVWVDFNQDGDFDDANELVFAKDKSKDTSVSGDVAVPADATLGETRMRVIMQYNQQPASSCGTYNYGETEDYTVNIVNGGDNEAPTAPSNLSSNTVTHESLNLTWTASTDNVGVTGYKIYKNGAYLTSTASTSYSVTGLAANTEYNFYVIAYDAAGNLSGASNTHYVTTATAPDTEAPTAPSNLQFTLNASSVDLSWTASTDNVGVTGYRIFKDDAYYTTVTELTYTDSEITPDNYYEYYIVAEDAAGNYSNQSNTVEVTTPAAGTTYCDSKGNKVTDEWINKVECESINKTSGANNGYADFTSISTVLNKDNNTTIKITPGWSGTVYSEGYSVWIDYNQDGDFTDSGEQVFTHVATKDTPIEGTFIVSTSALEGQTRMRVSMKYNGIPTSCETFDYGEVEDYTVDIQNSGDTQAPTDPTNLTSSNIAQTSVDLSWSASTDNVGVTGYKIYKGGAYITSVAGTSYSVTGLTASTTYSFYVKAYDAAGNLSDASNTTNVTTLDEPDTQAPTAPTSLSSSNVTQTTLNLSWTASTDNVGVTGYKVYKGGTLLNTSSSTSFSVTGLTANTAYSFYVKAYDAAGNLSDASNTVNVTTASGGVSYCTSLGQKVSDEWLQKVEVGTINNNSGENGGYADFTNLSTDMLKGGNISITLTPAWSGTVYNEAFSVWIDYNQDGDFSDSGEQVYTHIASKDNPVSGSFVVPSTALEGSTRMRVSMQYNAIPTECQTFQYGEVEDYTVNITSSGSDTEAPTAPASLTASNITQTTIDLSWTASTDNVGVTDYDIYKDGVLLTSVSGTSTQVTGLTANTSYSFYVKAKDAAGNVSAASNTVNATTASAVVTYCETQGNSVNDEWLDRVVIGSIDNNSGANGGYKDFTSISTTMVRSTQYNVTLYPAWSGTVYSEGFAVWIDYNQDGDFEDAGELVYSHDKTQNTSVSGSFTIPASASLGTTRMRVTMQYNTIPSSCGNFDYGEAEDYTVNITSSKSNNKNSKASDGIKMVIYPNPAKDELFINVNGVKEYTKISIYSITGSIVKETYINENDNRINISNIPAGIYSAKITINGKVLTAKFIKQ